MRRYVLLLAAALCACNQAKIAQLESQNKDLTAKVEATSKQSSLDLQEKCSRQAREEFKAQGYTQKDLAGYANHYAASLNKCFMEIRVTDTKAAPGQIITTRSVIDAFEGKQYGDYFWETEKGKKYYEVKPFLCKVTLQSGEEKVCSSDEEFTELVKPYMEQ